MTSINQEILDYANAEIERLRAVNAELVATLEDIADYDGAIDGVKAVARDAIAKARREQT